MTRHPSRRQIARDPIARGIYAAGKLSATERGAELNPLRHAFRQLSTGVATLRDWQQLASSVEIAQAVERQGIVRGASGHLHAAELALQAIHQRAGDGLPYPVPHLGELDVLQDAIDIHALQISSLSHGELAAAKRSALYEVQSSGGTVVHVEQGQAQGALSL